jgi:hypothetical protein
MYSQDYLVERYYLDEDGDLFYRSNGKIATHNRGIYSGVVIHDTKFYTHHVIWCMVYGYWPEHGIDHRDGDRYNNHPNNLREATMSQNIANAAFGKRRGVEKRGAKYRARIVVNQQRIELGSYDTFEEAQAAYQAGADRHFGEYAYHNRSD